MKRFRDILVIPSEPSAEDAALKRAAKLADSNAARLTVMWPLDESQDGGTGLEYFPDIVRALEDELEKAAESYREQGLAVNTRVRAGRPFVEIIRQVHEAGHDLVVKTARGQKLEQSLFFGTTALHLLRKCPCPVWIVNPKPGERTGVLAAVDPDTEDEKAHQLNQTIMELAKSLSILEEMDLHVVHAWNAPHEDMIRHSPWLRISRNDADGYIKGIEGRHRERFRHSAPHMEAHFVKSIPDRTFPKNSGEAECELEEIFGLV